MPAGRPAGSSTKNKEYLLKRLQDMYGEDFHPILNMAKNAVTLQDIADTCAQGDMFTANEDGVPGLKVINASSSALDAIGAWDKVAAYTEPKLKALEITGDPENPVTTLVIAAEMPPDQAEEIYKKLCE